MLGSQETPSLWTDPQMLQPPTEHLWYFKTRRHNLPITLLHVAPRSRDTYPDASLNFFDRIVSIFFQYLFLGCDCLYYLVSDLDSQS